MDTIQLSNLLRLDENRFIASIVPFDPVQYSGLNHHELVKAFIHNLSIALVTENHDEYEKHLGYMFKALDSVELIHADISTKVYDKYYYLRAINRL